MSKYSELLRDPRWQKKRLEIFQRDNWTCQYCRRQDKTLNVHHIKYEGLPWEVEDRCLITLCAHCHELETDLCKTNIDLNRVAEMTLVPALFQMELIRRVIEDRPNKAKSAFDAVKDEIYSRSFAQDDLLFSQYLQQMEVTNG